MAEVCSGSLPAVVSIRSPASHFKNSGRRRLYSGRPAFGPPLDLEPGASLRNGDTLHGASQPTRLVDPSLASPVRNAQFPKSQRRPAICGRGRQRAECLQRRLQQFRSARRAGMVHLQFDGVPGRHRFFRPLEISPNNTGLTPSSGFSSTTPFVGSLDGGLTPFHYLRDPFPEGLVAPTRDSLGFRHLPWAESSGLETAA